MSSLPRHPDTISGLAPDCRRVLRQEYMRIQVAMQPERLDPVREFHYADAQGTPQVRQETFSERKTRLDAQRAREVAHAITEYRRVAAMWGVEV